MTEVIAQPRMPVLKCSAREQSSSRREAMATHDIAIPVVFPDYKIMIEMPAVKIEVPDLIPKFDILPASFSTHRSKQLVPYLGHAGILFIDGGKGMTRYYEYGRYDPAAKGWTRKQSISDVKMAANGRPIKNSLKTTLKQVSDKAGHHGKIVAAYIELLAGAFVRMDAAALARMRDNSNPKREEYGLISNSCCTFMKQIAEAGGASMPYKVVPQPAAYIDIVRMTHPGLDFDPAGTFVVQDVELQ